MARRRYNESTLGNSIELKTLDLQRRLKPPEFPFFRTMFLAAAFPLDSSSTASYVHSSPICNESKLPGCRERAGNSR